jgi:protein TonB
LHVAALIALPQIGQRVPAPLHVLEVVLVRPEPPAAAEPPRPTAVQPAVSHAKQKGTGAMPNRLPAQEAKREPRPGDPVVAEEAPSSTLERRAAFAEPAVSPSFPPAQSAKPAATPGEPSPVAHESAPVSAPIFNAGYLYNPPPRYPLIARRNGEEGTVLLKVLVARDGVPSAVTVEGSSGSEHLDRAALEAVWSWRFVPAKQGGRAIEAWVRVPIVFRLEGSS